MKLAVPVSVTSRNAWINRFRALNNVIPFARKYADRMGFDLRALIGAEVFLRSISNEALSNRIESIVYSIL